MPLPPRALLLAGCAALGAASNLPSDFPADDWGVAACSAATGCCCETLLTDNGSSSCSDTEKLLCEYNKIASDGQAATDDGAAAFLSDANQLWIVTAGALVFFMQCGFAMLEAGSVRTRNTQNIVFKNLVDVCVAAVSFFCFGYAFAYGDGSKEGGDAGRFIGANNFFLMKESNDETGQAMWFFQFAFAATAATIVSGSVAERTKISAYFIYSITITTFIYPVVVHWVWSSHGWLSAFAPKEERLDPNGMIDYAGSGVVHAVGGFAGLCGAIVVGPRKGRFEQTTLEDGTVKHGAPLPLQGQSTMLSALGVMILWFGWYGFNCGSTLAFDGENAGKVATTTTLSAGSAGLAATFAMRLYEGHWPVEHGLNGILAGLVSITAGCSVVDEWAAILIGLIGGLLYCGACQLLLKLRIDDPLSAWPVHGACGVWGCLAVGIFAQSRNIARAYGDGLDGKAPSNGEQFAVQLCGIVAIVGWTVGLCGTLFLLIDKTMGMRISAEEEDVGLDVADHGADPTATWVVRNPTAGNPADNFAATLMSQQPTGEQQTDPWLPPFASAPPQQKPDSPA